MPNYIGKTSIKLVASLNYHFYEFIWIILAGWQGIAMLLLNHKLKSFIS